MNKIRLTYILAFLLLTLQANANRKMPPLEPLSKSSYISLLTCAPGGMLYSQFGHSAIGVYDPVQRINWVFNYGTFNFNVPHFYLKFASGKLLYRLSYESKTRFLQEYMIEQRKVTEDILNLSPYQKQKLFDLLVENYKPENREYQYDFFFDNCATRIVDILYEALGDSLQYIAPESTEVKTFRNLIDEYLFVSHWSDFGIDIALGSVIDEPATDYQKAFLPDYLKIYLTNCNLNGEPFFIKSREIIYNSAPLPHTNFLLSPKLWIWLLFLGIAILSFVYRHKSWAIADRIIFSSIGLIGIIVMLLWFATDHDATAGNLNILWANPLYIVFAWLIGSDKKLILKWSSLYILVSNLIILVTWSIIPQQYHILFIPLIGMLIVRSFILMFRNWK